MIPKVCKPIVLLCAGKNKCAWCFRGKTATACHQNSFFVKYIQWFYPEKWTCNWQVVINKNKKQKKKLWGKYKCTEKLTCNLQIICLTILPLHDAAYTRLFFLLLQSIHLRACTLEKLKPLGFISLYFIIKTNQKNK